MTTPKTENSADIGQSALSDGLYVAPHCRYCMLPERACPLDASCDAGMARRVEALEDEMNPDEWRVYLLRRIKILLDETWT
jgi:hypothetical protein